MEEDPRGPEGFQVDVFGIGVAKCATGWMARCLSEHPEVTVTDVKESHFFSPQLGFDLEMEDNPRFLADWDWYVSTFDHGDPDDVFVDYSVSLAWNGREGAEAVQGHNDEAKILVMLRDPAERLHSAYWHRRRHAERDPPDTFEAFVDDPRALDRSRYAQLLEPWFETFPRERIFVGLDLDLKADPGQLFADTCRFLDVDDTVQPPSLRERVNPQTDKHAGLLALEKTAETARSLGAGGIIDALNRIGLGPALRDKGTRVVDRPDPDPATMQRIRERLADDIDATEDLIERDLSPWKPSGEAQSSSSGDS